MLATCLALVTLSQAVDVQVELIDPDKPVDRQPIVQMGRALEELPLPPSAVEPEPQGVDHELPVEQEQVGPPESHVPHPFPFQVWKKMKPGDELFVVGDVKSPGLLIEPGAYLEFCHLLERGVGEYSLPLLKRMLEQGKILLITKTLRVSVSDFV